MVKAVRHADQSLGWEGYLAPDETVIWQGKPQPYFALGPILEPSRLKALIPITIAVIWTLAAIIMTTDGKTPLLFRLIFPMFGLIPLAAGINALAGPEIRAYLRHKSATYTLTTHHVMIAHQVGHKKTLQSFDLREITPILTQGPPPSIWFGTQSSGERFGFSALPQASDVYAQLIAARATRTKVPPPAP